MDIFDFNCFVEYSQIYPFEWNMWPDAYMHEELEKWPRAVVIKERRGMERLQPSEIVAKAPTVY